MITVAAFLGLLAVVFVGVWFGRRDALAHHMPIVWRWFR